MFKSHWYSIANVDADLSKVAACEKNFDRFRAVG